jgi:hypothetical protein
MTEDVFLRPRISTVVKARSRNSNKRLFTCPQLHNDVNVYDLTVAVSACTHRAQVLFSLART